MLKNGRLYITTPMFVCNKTWDTRHVKEYSPVEIHDLLSPFFKEVRLSYFWPRFFTDFYETKIGWRLLKRFSKYFYNPFLKEGLDSSKFYQILAICKGPLDH